MSDHNSSEFDSTPHPADDRPHVAPSVTEGPATVYDRPQRTSGGTGLYVGLALIVLALVVFLLFQFVF